MQYLAEQGKGFKVGKQVVPIVVGASIFDLEYKNFAFPDKAAGYNAAKTPKKTIFLPAISVRERARPSANFWVWNVPQRRGSALQA